ncbi:MAG: carboxypeptidase regulatory-like domain-containing protein [Terracidiphilus sp.]
MVLLALFPVTKSRAQATGSTASITGTVTDASGAVVPGATIQLTDPATGQIYKGVTNGTGSYTIGNISPGPGYTETVAHAGFQTTVLTGLYLNIGATRSQNVKLAIGSVTQTVAVSAANQTVTLDTTDAVIGNNFQVQVVNDMPVSMRDTPSALFTQQPGFTQSGSATGSRNDQDQITLDGLVVSDQRGGVFTTVVANAPVDSVQEFRGNTAGDLASEGAGGGGQFELVTKSGTNKFHGNINEYHRDTDLEANEWFNNFNGQSRPPLVRNQFGGNIGGPIWRNKIFFFFDYNGRRDALSTVATRTIPTQSFLKDNEIKYYTNIANGTTSSVSAAQVAKLDPQLKGFDSAMMSVIGGRYPVANDTTIGDQLNTSGFLFNSPKPYTENNEVGRVDLSPFANQHFFGRVTYNHINSVNKPPEYPGDPETYPLLDTSHAWVVGWDWTMGNNKTNSVVWGSTVANIGTPVSYNPQGANQYGWDGDPTGGTYLSGIYGSANSSSYYFPLPIVRDDFHWDKGRHSFAFGGDFQYPSPHYSVISDFNAPDVGLGGNVTALPTNGSSNWNFDPGDIDNSTQSLKIYQSALVFALGRFEDNRPFWNYNAAGSVVPQGTGLQTTFRYYQTEFYFEDSWKILPNLTFTYGIRYQNTTVPYEIHGIEANQSLSFWDFMNARVKQSAAGVGGPASLPGGGGGDTVPYITYNLAGKANKAAGYYQPDNKDFAPRIAFAWTPTADRKLVINGGAGIIYDQTVVNAIIQQEASYSYLFQSNGTIDYGVPATPGYSAAYNSLLGNTRFTALNEPPVSPTIPTITKPYTPFVGANAGCSAAGPCGLALGSAFNVSVDHVLPTPYNIMYNLGIQQQLKGGFLLRLGFVGRLGRHLLAQADAEQLVDFPDPKSGQTLSQAIGALTTWLRANPNAPTTSAPQQPFFENVLNQAAGNTGSKTSFIATNLAPYPSIGDVADSVELMSAYGMLPDNVGMAAQLSENTFFTDMGFSSYNGMLASLHKNIGQGLMFDLNYTWSHSIDNTSLVATGEAYNGYGFICDVLRPRRCRGNSDFDVTQYLNGNFVYDLPFGRGREFGASVPHWADEAIGGWELSGLPIWHTGTPYMANSIAFLMSYSNEDPAILTGSLGPLKSHVTVANGHVYDFANPQLALNQFSGPVGFEMGSRNNLRGPHFFDLDAGLGKTFPLFGIRSERTNLKFRVDAFNVLNHPNFQSPSFTGNMDITASPLQFGVIPGTVTPDGSDLSARVLQGSLRVEF